jgi:hypothetical protein
MSLWPTRRTMWRELQLAASASAGGLRTQSSDGDCMANFGLLSSVTNSSDTSRDHRESICCIHPHKLAIPASIPALAGGPSHFSIALERSSSLTGLEI